MSPEHIHVMLNHLPLIGLALAVIPLVLAVGRKDTSILFVGLLLAFISSLPIPVVMSTGETAEEKFEAGEILPALDEAGDEWMHEHYERAETGAKAVYLTILVAGLGLAAMKFRPQYQFHFGIAAAVLTIICVGALAWIADSGGKIRHPEFREQAAAVVIDAQL